jgi:predicted CXXCH cytochrome family protein
MRRVPSGNTSLQQYNMVKRNRHILPLFIFFLLAISLIFVNDIYPSTARPHGDRTKLLKGCASCHKGHGVFGTAMLPEGGPAFCYRCHGSSSNVGKTRREGDLAENTKAADVEAAFEKPYRHPVERTNIHRFGETLPETDPSIQRHAVCEDCHNAHYVMEDNVTSGVRGTDAKGIRNVPIQYEYELCFNCHSSSANLPSNETNKAELFGTSSASYHPVVSAGKNADVPSLQPPLTTASLIKCTDCHNNDDPAGARGPHGSSHKHILATNFSESDGEEGITQYELCYSCHRRTSILNNESFPYHSLHISFVGTSCRTCHNPHGSTRYPHLIDFDYNMEITPSSGGKLGYTSFAPKAGQCYLTCHNKDHNPAVYPAGNISPDSLPSQIKSKKTK